MPNKCPDCGKRVKIIRLESGSDVMVEWTPVPALIQVEGRQGIYKIKYVFMPHRSTCVAKNKYKEAS